MKQIYLQVIAAAAMVSPMAATAENQIYFPGEGAILGNVGGISANGRYAAIYDDENEISYLWDAENPEDLTMLPGKSVAFDVSNDGVVAGQVNIGNYAYHPAVYVDGEWKHLPIHATTLNTAFARRISPDGKVLGGILCVADESVETGKGYRACIWKMNDAGEYELTTYNALPAEVAHHQGFWMYDMTDDGSVIAGFIMCGATQCQIPALLKDGEYIYPGYSIEAREEPWYYKDKLMGYDTEYYINGYHDTNSMANFNGAFVAIDQETGNCYGMRTQAFDVDEDGNGRLVNGACIYNYNTGEYTTDDTQHSVYYGFDEAGTLFLSNGQVLKGGNTMSISEAYGVTYNEDLVAIAETSADKQVLGGCHAVSNPATGEYQYFPFIIVRDQSGSVDVTEAQAGVEVRVAQGQINVEGAQNVAIFDIQGRLVSNAASTSVEAGAYIVKADNTIRKVLVK